MKGIDAGIIIRRDARRRAKVPVRVHRRKAAPTIVLVQVSPWRLHTNISLASVTAIGWNLRRHPLSLGLDSPLILHWWLAPLLTLAPVRLRLERGTDLRNTVLISPSILAWRGAGDSEDDLSCSSIRIVKLDYFLVGVDLHSCSGRIVLYLAKFRVPSPTRSSLKVS